MSSKFVLCLKLSDQLYISVKNKKTNVEYDAIISDIGLIYLQKCNYCMCDTLNELYNLIVEYNNNGKLKINEKCIYINEIVYDKVQCCIFINKKGTDYPDVTLSNPYVSVNRLLPHYNNLNKFNECFANTIKIMGYTDFDFTLIDEKYYDLLFSCNSMIVNHFVNLSIDLNKFKCDNKKLVHVLLKYSNDLDAIENIFEKKINLECTDNNNWNILHYLCYYSSENVAITIINKYILPLHHYIAQNKTNCGKTPLQLAIIKLKFGVVESLYENQTKLNIMDENGNNLIHNIIEYCNMKTIHINNTQNVIDENNKNCIDTLQQIINFIISKYFEMINEKNKDGLTPLALAKKFNCKLTNFLIKKGAKMF